MNPRWKLEVWEAAKANGIELPETPDRFEMGGNPERGKKVVMEHAAAQCIRCHQIGSTPGSNLGPELTKIGRSRSRAQLVDSLLNPSRDISDGFGTIILKTKGGEDISGILSKKEEKAWTITLADSSKKVIDPKEVESHTLTSVMPPVGAILKPSEIRDVVSYLAGLR